jgi:hypothetical protein
MAEPNQATSSPLRHSTASMNHGRPPWQGLGVTLGMSPLVKARSGFGKRLVASLWIAETVGRAK